MTDRITPAFNPDCTKKEAIFGWIYLVVHMFALPLLLNWLQPNHFPNLSAIHINGVYYGISFAVVMVVYWKLLRREFDHLMDRFLRCITSFCWAYLIWYFMSSFMVSVMTILEMNTTTPNDQAVDVLMTEGYNITLVISVIGAPILEEVLFRGIAFQSLRRKNRILAYAVSMGLFGLYHTWQFAVAYADPIHLLHIVQYIPITFALTYCYERSGSLWTPIFFHAFNNWLALQLQTIV